jgi:hypothetical protein
MKLTRQELLVLLGTPVLLAGISGLINNPAVIKPQVFESGIEYVEVNHNSMSLWGDSGREVLRTIQYSPGPHYRVEVVPKFAIDDSVTLNVKGTANDAADRVSTAILFNSSFSLSGAGLDVQPSDWIPTSTVQNIGQPIAVWTLRAKEPGHYKLVLRSRVDIYPFLLEYNREHHTKDKSLTSPTFLNFPPRAPIELEATQKWIQFVRSAWPGFAAFMGTFLTLPGLFKLYGKWRREREKDESDLVKMFH